jgi:type IV secretory pathway TrbF-like protein
VQARNWRLAFFGAFLMSGGLAGGLVWQSVRGTVTPWVVQIDKLGQAQVVAPAVADYRPTDPQVAWHLARFIEEVRRIPADPVVLRHDWLEAYRFVTDRGALALNDYARISDPFSKVGKTQISVEVASVVHTWGQRGFGRWRISRLCMCHIGEHPRCSPILRQAALTLPLFRSGMLCR